MSALVDEQKLEAAPHDAECKPPRIKPHTTSEITPWLRTPKTIWCPGCSNGTITRALIDAILGLQLDPEKVVVVAGIGCSGRIAQYLEYSTVHTAHGRALAVATGVKTADPSLHVIVAMGDGDCSAIGGNHFIHAARRNIDVTALVFNNSIYGMTGGQMSPTTHMGDKSTTSVRGNVEAAFDLSELAHAAGATYVARGTAWARARAAALPLWTWLLTVAVFSMGGPGDDIILSGRGLMAYAAPLVMVLGVTPPAWVLWRRGRVTESVAAEAAEVAAAGTARTRRG